MKSTFRRIVNCSLLLFLITYPLFLSAQADSGFISKMEAKNQIVNGLREGKWIEYYTNKADIEDKETMLILTKDTNAPYYDLEIYKDGKKDGIERQYLKNGILKNEFHYINGKLTGIGKYYYESGKIKSEVPYVDGKLINGIVKEYYENGKLKSETTFINSKEETIKKYDENGKVVK